ncbi:MAG: hypothetical protein SV062_01940 [Thermodesulfobacteriota bacterium]|nr:hypothetical protein [Thermodesulfobacteriota bacterium]
MTKNFDVYLRLNKKELQNKYVVIVDGKMVVKGKALGFKQEANCHERL